MQTVKVDLGQRSYNIFVGEGILSEAGDLLTEAGIKGKVAVVTNPTVAQLYLDTVHDALEGSGFAVTPILLPDGEEHKTLSTLSMIFDRLIGERFERNSCIVALGGGVVGDVAGFAAATYLRGTPFVQVPTTLLAQVDSSVGGKTGVNHPRGKNLIGAFHQPRCVLADTSTLQTLSPREYRAGLAEVIKYGFVRDVKFLEWLETNADKLVAHEDAAVMLAVRRSCEIKADVVGQDEREQGLRAILNLGHTFGHAIETASGYGSWLHGEAVAAGMAMAAEMSERLGWLQPAERDRVVRLLNRLGLPTAPPRIGAQRGRELMGMDKKVLGGRIRLVLLKELGHAVVVDDYAEQAFDATLQA